ncbi:MAG: hypothetical protein CMJ18_22205 [Phycisphaeraceae bacterium]|nr:hypothetical protein [Phycisphaeraceae bacterium]
MVMRFWLFTIFVVIPVTVLPSRAADTLDLRDMAGWRIVVDDDASPAERYAADEFHDLFLKVTGHDLPTVREIGESDGNIFIGAGRALEYSSLDYTMKQDYAPEQLRVVVQKDNIAIVGGRPRGVLYGVYQFLEECLGVRFLTRDHVHVPRLESEDSGRLQEVDFTFTPPLTYRMLYYTEVMQDPKLSARLRMNATGPGMLAKFTDTQKARIGGYVTGYFLLHSIGSWMGDYDADSDPAIRALQKDGKRSPRQFCMSHPKVIRRVTANVALSALKHGKGATIRVVPEDAGRCECERCHGIADEYGGAHAAVVIKLVNDVARKVAMVRPDLTIGTLAYAWYRKPPENMPVESNVRIQYATYHACQRHPYDRLSCPTNVDTVHDIRTWRTLTDDLCFWHYSVNFNDYLAPPTNLDAVASQIRTSVALDGRGIMMQGPGSGLNCPFADMMMYLMARMMWDPGDSPTALREQFIDLHYGAAAPDIRRYLDLQRRTQRNGEGHSNCNGPFDEFGLSVELGRKGIEIFEQARAAAATQVERDRVEKASVGAYRLALGHLWYGKAPDDMSDTERRDARKIAGRLFELCRMHDVRENREGQPVRVAAQRLRKALDMKDGEAF